MKKFNPLQQAIVNNDIKSIENLRESKWIDQKDLYGFTPVDLARLLGKKEIEKLFLLKKPLTIKVLLKGETVSKLISIKEFEQLFSVVYRSFLTFHFYESIEKAIHHCPLFFKYQWIFGKKDDWETYYQELMLHGFLENALLKWIDDEIGYGLFAEANLDKGAFIGEYTGVFSSFEASNAYCFQYPHRLFSKNYFIIDAEKEGNLVRFINHSENPNLEPLWLYDRGILHLILITKHPIIKGEEFTFCYGADFWKYRTNNANYDK